MSGTSGYMYTYYYSYVYKSGSTDYRGWATFDLNDVKAWEGVEVKSARLVMQNYYTYYIKQANFTALKTTPFYSMGSTAGANVWKESGPSGTQIGSVAFTTTSDTTYHPFTVDLNEAAVKQINNTIMGTSKYKTFGIGFFVDSLVSGYSYGYARWNDIRLELSFQYSKELQPTTKGNGVAFGDDISGQFYKRTSASNRPYGYAYYRKSTSYEYRGYYQWNVPRIVSAFEAANITNIKFKRVYLRFNHRYSSMSGINVYHLKYNMSSTVSDDNKFTDCGDGAAYYTSGSVGSTYNEYEWELSKDAVKAFQDAFEDSTPDYFGVGLTSTSTSGYAYDYGPRLVLEWGFPEPAVVAAIKPVKGYEGTPVQFNANESLNLSGGSGALRYEWDWNYTGTFKTDKVTSIPYADNMWPDDAVAAVALRVNDTDSGQNATTVFNVTIYNVGPKCNKSRSSITPDPAWEAGKVNFSGFFVEDPAGKYDTYHYYWDFDGDEIFDVNGSVNSDMTIPSHEWYYDDDFLGDAWLLITDHDGGSNNITTSFKKTFTPPTSYPYGTGYIYYYGTRYYSSVIYYRWSYTYDYQRGFAKIDISDIPTDAKVNSVEFKGYVSYNRSVNMIGVHLLETDPVTGSASTVFTESGSSTNRIFGLTGSPGEKKVDMTPFIQTTAGKAAMETALGQGWVGFGFNVESPQSGYTYGYMQGYAYSYPSLEIGYITEDPGCLHPVVVKNRPPVVNCKNLTLTPTTGLKEGDTISVSNFSFCDVGNDTYEAQIVIGGEYETEWFPLGGPPIPPGSATKNLALDATASHSGGGVGVWGPARLNNGDKTGTYNDCWTTGGGWVQLEWKNPVLVNSMKVYYTRWRSLPATYCLHTCDVQWWDGTSWQTDQKWDDKSYGTNNDHDIKMKAVRKTTKVRLYNMWAGYNVMIQEWEVFGPGSGNWTPGWGAQGPGCFDVNITVNATVWDDYPSSGTSWDNVPITINVRDDDDHKLIPGTGAGSLDSPVTVSSSAYYYYSQTNSRKIAIDNDYNIYVIYIDQQKYPYQVYVAKSNNNGVSWDHFKVSTGSWHEFSYQYYPSIAIDSNGVLHAIWTNANYAGQYANSVDGGKTWGNFYNFSSSGYIYWPAIAVDGNDDVHITWSGYSSYPYKIWYINRDSTGTWGKIKQISESLYSYYPPTIAADSKGNVHIVWSGYTSTYTYFNVRHRMYTASTSSWSTITNLTNAAYYNYYPCITVDSSDNVHLVWNGHDSVITSYYNIMYNKWSSTSKSWGTKEYITKITASYPYQYNPSIAINAKGEIDVMWHGYQSPSWTYPYAIHHAERSGTSWNIDWNVHVSSGYQYFVNLFCSPQHNIAKQGYAYIWFDNYYQMKYMTSKDFEYGNPEFTDGLDFCNRTVRVDNVAPKIDLRTMYTVPTIVKEQEPFQLFAEFEDPAAGAHTEIFEYNITWGAGGYTGWQKVEKFRPGVPGGLKERTFQPDGDEGQDAQIYSYYQDYNFATYPYSYMGSSGSNVWKSLIRWNLNSIPAGYNVTNATMTLNYAYRYGPPYQTAEKAYWYPVNSSWSEGTNYYETVTGAGVTWRTRPNFDMTKPIAYTNWAYGGGPVDYYLNTTIVQGWIDNPMKNFGMITQFEDEDGTDNNYGYFYTSDYQTESLRPKLVLTFDKPLPATLPRGVISGFNMIPDDHPDTGTPYDVMDLKIEVKDDDLGSDSAKANLTVHNVPPEVKEGTITPEELDEGIDEGTWVTLEGFEFDDVAYDVPTEKDYGFNYSIDWGDGTPATPWANDFRYNGPVGAGAAGGGGDMYNVVPNAWEYSPGTSANTIPWGPAFNTRRYMQWYNGAEFNKMAYNFGSIGYRYPSRYGTFSITYSNLKIYIMHTTATSLSSTFANNYGTDRTLCLSKSSFTWTKTAIAPNIQDDFTMIPLDFPFKYDGRSNVIVEIQYTSGSPNTYNYFEAGSNTNIHRMWANSPTATSGSVGSNYGLCTKFVGGVGGEMVNEVVFSSATAYNNGAKLLMDSDNNLYSVYTDREGTKPTQISISNSSDLGESWFQNPVTKATTRQLEPSVAIDSKDVLHVVWRGLVSSYYQIHYANSANGGVSWANQKTITSTSAHNYAPSIAIDSNDMAHIVWHGGSGSNIYYTSRTSTGKWDSTSALNSNIGEYAAIAVDSEDDLHIVWSGQTSWATTDNIQYMKYDSSATSWSSVTMLTNSSSNDNGHPSIAADRNDNIHVTWDAEPSPNAIMHMKWDAGTSSWMSAEIVSTNASANNMNPSVGVDHRGYVYVFWFKTNPYMIMMSMFDDRYWTGDLEVSSLRELNKTTWHAGVLSSGGKLPARGSAVVFTADNGTAYNVYYIPTRDLNLTDYGPWKGIPKFKHLYRDDNPTKSERNFYTAKIRVRDDDTGIGSWSMRFEVRNVWPEIKEKEWVAKAEGLENMLYSPRIKFKDPGSGPTENWTLWMDMDNSENWTAGDHFFDDPSMYDVEVINDVSHVTINPMLIPCNDDYEGKIGVYVYDDDIPDKRMFWNVTWVETMGKVLLVNKSTTTDSYEKILYDWFEVQAKKEGWKFDYKPWSTSLCWYIVLLYFAFKDH
jgi:hypothetical protein